MYLTLLTFFHVAVCVLLILIVLLQHGRGADMGATFGGGSNTLFGASGADNLLTRVTTVLAGLFMALSVCLASSLHSGNAAKSALFENLPANSAPVTSSEKTIEIPAAPADAPKTPDAQPAAGAAVAPVAPVAAAGTENNSSPTTATSNSTGNNNAVVVDANAVAKQVPVSEPAAGSPLANEIKVTDTKPLADVVPQAAPVAANGNAPEGSASK